MKKLFILAIISCFAVMAQAYTKEYLLKRAEAGDAEAQYNVADNYFYQWSGFPKDYEKGIHWLRKSAENGYLTAQVDLANIYRDGRYGLPHDMTEYIKWATKAAENGGGDFNYSLGVYFLNKDEDKARFWLKLSWNDAVTFNADFKDIKKLLKKLGVKCKSHNFFLDVSVYQDLANAKEGSAWAQYQVSKHYEEGKMGYQKDEEQMMYWLRKAAENGYSKAQEDLGEYYKWGEHGLTKDVNEYLKWTTKAADNGESGACYSLCLYYKGKDKKKAISYLKKSEDLSYFEFGDHYSIGSAVDETMRELGIVYDPATKTTHSLTAANNTSKTTKKTTTTSSKSKTVASKSVATSGHKYHDAAMFDLKGKVKSVKHGLDTYVFTKDGKYEKTINYDGKESFEDRYCQSVKRNSSGYVIQTESFQNSLIGIFNIKYTYNYDSLGRLEEITDETTGFALFIENGTDKTIFVRDQKGNIVSERMVNKNNEEYITKYTNIKTDSHGNWISRNRIKDGKSLKDTRTITYWK